MSELPLVGHWDFPWSGGPGLGSFVTRDGRLACSGWTAAESRVPSIEIYLDKGLFARATPSQPRDDVEIYRGHTYLTAREPTGWACALDATTWRPGPHEIAVVAHTDQVSELLGARVVEMPAALPDLEAHWRDLCAVLRCPRTGQPLTRADGVLQTSDGISYPTRGHQVFLSSSPGAWLQQATSTWGLSAFAREAIRESSGLVLAIGAGLGPTVPRLIQLDIVDFPNVDVIAEGATLPFADAAFDAVICENVIEHVPDPFALVAEIDRVLKPGGRVGLNGTNMHFTHGYPSHYFNATEFGMRLLLEERAHFEGQYEFAPIPKSLQTVLQFYVRALGPDVRKRVEALTVGELLEPSPASQALLASVPDRVRRALSTNIYFSGRKKS